MSHFTAPKDPDTLTKSALANIVRSIQALLFLEEVGPEGGTRDVWVEGAVVSGAQFVNDVVGLLDNFGLLPKEGGPKDWRPHK